MSDPAALLASLHTASAPRLAGDRVIFELSRPDLETDAYTTRLHAVPVSGPATACPRRVSSGQSDRDVAPAGEARALVRAAPRSPAQLWVGLGEAAPRAVTDEPLGILEAVLEASGRSALVVARDPQPGRYGTDPDVPAEAEAPRRITTAQYSANGLGYTLDRPARLLRVPLEDEDALAPAGAIPLPDPVEIIRLTGDVREPRAQHGRVSVLGPAVAPGTTPDLRSAVWIEADGSPVRLETGSLSVQSHAWLDHDRVLLLAADLGPSGTDFVARVAGLHLHDLRDGTTVRLTPEDRCELGGSLRIVDGAALCLQTHDGAERLVRITLPTTGSQAHVEPLTPTDWVVTGFDADADGRIVVTAATPTSAGDVVRIDAAESGEHVPVPLTALAGAAWSPTHRVTARTDGGDVHGWCAMPDGEGPHPVVLLIHGGPFAQYTAAVLDEVQAHLDAGVAVVWSNPRGSAGRGRDWGLAVRGNFAEPAATDVLAVLDAALEAHPRLDRTRQAVAGGSYGGYLTAMITATDHRFRAAIVERGFLDPIAFAGTSDIGTYFGREYVGEDSAEVARQSPLARAGEVQTPTLVMHSEQDLRCPLEQAQQYYAALLRHGAEAEMVVFPGEDHELSRSGRPRHRAARFEAYLDWWQRHLIPRADASARATERER